MHPRDTDGCSRRVLVIRARLAERLAFVLEPNLNLPRRHAQLPRKLRALLRTRERRPIVRRIQRPQLIRVRAPAFRLQRRITPSSVTIRGTHAVGVG